MKRLVRGRSQRAVLWFVALAAGLGAIATWEPGEPDDALPGADTQLEASAAADASRHAAPPGAAGTILFRARPIPARVAAANAHPPVPVELDRAAALAAAARGSIDIELPDGTRYPVRHDRSDTEPDGSWTFVGRVATPLGPLASVITFGPDGSVFGTLPTPDGDLLKLTTRGGQAFLQPAGWMVPPGADPSRDLDYVVAEPRTRQPGTSGAATPVAVPSAGASAPVDQGLGSTEGPVTITILAVYTRNLVQLRGSSAAAQAEYSNLVAVMNQAHIDSGTRARFQVAGFVQVDYPADATNDEAREDIIANTLPDGTDLRTLRDNHAADLVAMIRPYVEGDLTCGISQFPGPPLDPYRLDPDTGYSVTAVEACTPLVFAHELGHSLGLMHDRETVAGPHGATLAYGTYPFSFGHRQLGPPGFATVMAYDSASRPEIGFFSHPGTQFCAGVACGDAKLADNVRSINLVAGSIARFRDPVGTITISDSWTNEAEGYAFINVHLASPAPAGGVIFDLALEPVSATLGADFEPWHGASLEDIVIREGSSHGYAELRVFDDDAPESTESAGIRLRNVRGAVTVVDDHATLRIVDDDATFRVGGVVRFPPGESELPEVIEIYVRAVKDGVESFRSVLASPPLWEFESEVPQGAHVTIEPVHDLLLMPPLLIEEVDRPMSTVSLLMKRPVWMSGTLRTAAGQSLDGVPIILWNSLGDGSGHYANWSGSSIVSGYGRAVLPGVSMQLEVRDPPAPYVRQVVELAPIWGPTSARDIQLRTVPSLTIPHVTVTEGTADDGPRTILLTASLSVPRTSTGVEFDVELAGTADAGDFQLPTTHFSIPMLRSRIEVPVIVLGDDEREPDETIELRITNIQGAAWNPGPGSLRIATDDGRPGDGRCTGSTANGGAIMCQ